ncbi:MAG: hypothetical protein V4681_03550 [Patescibacteria group bacterium]
MGLSNLFEVGRIRWFRRLAAVFAIAIAASLITWVLGITPVDLPLMVFELACIVLGTIAMIETYRRGYWPLTIGVAIAMSLFFAIGWMLLLSARGTPIDGFPL